MHKPNGNKKKFAYEIVKPCGLTKESTVTLWKCHSKRTFQNPNALQYVCVILNQDVEIFRILLLFFLNKRRKCQQSIFFRVARTLLRVFNRWVYVWVKYIFMVTDSPFIISLSYFSRLTLGFYLWWNTSTSQIASKMFRFFFLFLLLLLYFTGRPLLRFVKCAGRTPSALNFYMRYQREWYHLESAHSQGISICLRIKNHATYSFRILYYLTKKRIRFYFWP